MENLQLKVVEPGFAIPGGDHTAEEMEGNPQLMTGSKYRIDLLDDQGGLTETWTYGTNTMNNSYNNRRGGLQEGEDFFLVVLNNNDSLEEINPILEEEGVLLHQGVLEYRYPEIPDDSFLNEWVSENRDEIAEFEPWICNFLEEIGTGSCKDDFTLMVLSLNDLPDDINYQLLEIDPERSHTIAAGYSIPSTGTYRSSWDPGIFSDVITDSNGNRYLIGITNAGAGITSHIFPMSFTDLSYETVSSALQAYSVSREQIYGEE